MMYITALSLAAAQIARWPDERLSSLTAWRDAARSFGLRPADASAAIAKARRERA